MLYHIGVNPKRQQLLRILRGFATAANVNGGSFGLTFCNGNGFNKPGFDLLRGSQRLRFFDAYDLAGNRHIVSLLLGNYANYYIP